MEFSRQEHWRGVPCPSQGDLPKLGIEPRSHALQGYSLLSEPTGKKGKKQILNILHAVPEISSIPMNYPLEI